MHSTGRCNNPKGNIMTHYLKDGAEVSEAQVKQAFANGLAVLVHHHIDGGINTGLMLDGKHFDTRGECYSMWDESWTTVPKTVQEALESAQ